MNCQIVSLVHFSAEFFKNQFLKALYALQILISEYFLFDF